MSQQSWNKFAEQNHGSFLQSWEWGMFQEKSGHSVHRLHIEQDNQTQIQSNIFTLHLPFAQRCLYAPFGPIIGQDNTTEHIIAFIHALRKLAQEKSACVIRIDATTKAIADVCAEQGFSPRRSAQPNTSLVVDLTKTDEQLLEEMHSKTRYNIRLAAKSGVVVRRADRKNAEQFAKDTESFITLLQQTTERDKFAGHNAEYYRDMLTTLTGSGDIETELYIAEREGKVLASAIMVHWNDVVTYLHGASSNADRQYMAPYALQWFAMQDGRAFGGTSYDFWGIAPNDDPTHPWAGITRFKKGFGGKVISYAGGWELALPNFWGTVYRITQKLRKK